MDQNTLYVGLGGIIGAIARYGLSLAFNPPAADSFPWGTLLCNFVGCLLLGWLSFMASDRLPPRLKLAITTGIIGAFTTFSTVSVETMHFLTVGRYGLALTYLLCSLWGGLACAALGARLSAVRPGGRKEGEQ